MLTLTARIGHRVERIPLSEGCYIIGRAPTSDIVIKDPTVSRRHFRLTVRAHRHVVEDLGSRHGLWVERQRRSRAEIEEGQWFAAGAVLFSVQTAPVVSGDLSC